MKKLGSILFHRAFSAAVSIILQLTVFALMITKFGEYFIPFTWGAVILSVAAVLWIVNDNSNGGYKIAWIILILALPVFGGVFYLLCQGIQPTRRRSRRLQEMAKDMAQVLSPDNKADKVAAKSGVEAGNMARYLEQYASCPAYADTQVTYYPLGDDCFQPMLDALRSAEKYIFLEYFIITPGIFWNSVLEILKEKASQGLDVRVIYDDIGCIHLPAHYAKELGSYGIQCVSFNRFMPVFYTAMNNRSHRKSCIVDGKLAFAGGINLADEYINRKERFGHWKDSALRLVGPGAWSMTVMYLIMWDFITGDREDPERFRPVAARFPDCGWVQPYNDCPWDDEPVGETVYLNLINKAEKYIYICTPYLVVDETMVTALVSAAKSGVNVCLITPHIPDKKTIFQVTRAHYEPLIRGGVKIFEYTPGFVHAKSFVVDDRYATVGSVNMDYRSFFLHFENGVFLTDSPAVWDIKRDFESTLKKCQQFTLEDCRKVSIPLRIFRGILRVFAPLL